MIRNGGTKKITNKKKFNVNRASSVINKKKLYERRKNILFKLNANIFTNIYFVKFVRTFLGSVIYAGKKYKINSLIIKCSKQLKYNIGLNFMQALFLVYYRLLPFIVLKRNRGGDTNKMKKKHIFGIKSQSHEARIKLALSWFKDSVRERSELRLESRIVGEIIDIINYKGNSINAKKDYYKSVFDQFGLSVGAVAKKKD